MESSSLKFLIATDVHLGHKEKHPVRSNDSYEAFSEVFEIAKANDVDFLLLGGDLFDQVNPSKQCLLKCLNILKDNIFGEKKPDIQVTIQNHHEEYKPNFATGNINISLPIFTIHGNHDYPANDFGKISVCDLLHASSYVNYFGKYQNLKTIILKPLIFKKAGRKGKLAIYGLGYIKDAYLNQMFDENRVIFEKPQGSSDDYFCLFIFHQNRYNKHTRVGTPYSQCIDPKRIPSWIDLTIWGHEHEAIYNIDTQNDRNIFQPGSTIPTSFIQAESYMKQCALLKISGKKDCQIQSHKLSKSYRPLIFQFYEVSQLKKKALENQKELNLYQFLQYTISNIIEASESTSSKKPIVRIKVQYTGIQDLVRYKQIQLDFEERVANKEKIIVFWKRKPVKAPELLPEDDKRLFQAFVSKDNSKIHKELKDQILELAFEYSDQMPSSLWSNQCRKDLVTKCIKEETSVLEDILNNALMRISDKKLRPTKEKIDSFGKIEEDELEKAKSVYCKQITFALNGHFTEDCQEEFHQRVSFEDRGILSGEGYKNMLSYHERETQKMLGKVQDIQFDEEARNHQKKSEIMSESSERLSILKREPKSKESTLTGKSRKSNKKTTTINSDEDHAHQRSDSEDCCKRAQKQQYHEERAAENFKFVEEKIKKEVRMERKMGENKKLKRNEGTNKSKKYEPKNVSFKERNLDDLDFA